jgi:ELWxxDGT repeat protein
MSFQRSRSRGFALAFGEVLESRLLLSGVYTATRLTSLPHRAWEIGPSNVTACGNDVVFDATNPATRRQAIWVSDGTRRGTKPLATTVAGDELLLGVNGSQIFFAAFSTPLFFNPNSETFDTQSTAEMYVTGDHGKTCIDLGALPAGAGEGGSVVIGDEFYFTTGSALWLSDGTPVGTHQVTMLNNGPQGTYARLIAIGNSILIEGGGEIDSVNLGSLSQQEIANEVTGDAVMFNGKAYFLDDSAGTYIDGQPGPYDLWSTDGTSGGTVDVFGSASNHTALPNVQAVGVAAGKLLLLGIPDQQGTSADSASTIYTCDGTAASITPIAVYGGDVTGEVPVESDGRSLFASNPFTPASRLWETDGTATGTQAVLKGFSATPEAAAGDIVFAAMPDSYTQANNIIFSPIHRGPGQLLAIRRSAVASSKLVASIVGSTLAASTAGSTTRDTVTIQITNIGDKPGGKGTVVTLLLSTDALGSQLATIRTYRLNVAFAPGESRLITLRVTRLPVVSAGRYFLIAQLATATGGFIQTNGVDPIEVAAAFSFVHSTAKNVQDAQGFDSGKLSFELLNNSNSTLTETDTVSIYASDSQSVVGSTEVATQSVRLASAPGHGRIFRLAIANPDWETALQYSVLIVQLANNSGLIAQATVELPTTG